MSENNYSSEIKNPVSAVIEKVPLTAEEKNRLIEEKAKEKVALRFFVIGIGNAGNQLVNIIDDPNIDVFAVNSSKSDLDNNVVKSNIKSYIIGKEGRGAGKNRTVGLKCFAYNGKQLLTHPTFTNMCDKAEVIIVSGSTAGGTGSAVAPLMIKALKIKYPRKIIMYLGVLPRLTDSVQAQKNSIDCLDEIMSYDVPYLLADLNYYHDIPNDIAYVKIQEYLANCIYAMKGRYLNKSSFGMIDENDMRTVLAESGYLSIYDLKKVSQTDLDQESMQHMMIELIKNSPAAEIMRDGIVKQMAAIINMPEDMTDSSKASDYTELISYIGRPISIFENYAVTNSANGQMIIILSGQTTPFNRISEMGNIVQESVQVLKKKKDFDFDDLTRGFESESEIPSFLLDDQPNTESKSNDLDDFFSNL